MNVGYFLSLSTLIVSLLIQNPLVARSRLKPRKRQQQTTYNTQQTPIATFPVAGKKSMLPQPITYEAYDEQSNQETHPQEKKERAPRIIEELPPQAKIAREQKTVEEFDQPPLRPTTAVSDDTEKVEVNFEEAPLKNITQWISQLFNVSFISNDAVNPPIDKGAYNIGEHKLTFKSHIPLTKKQIWDLFIIFLDLSGLSVKSSSVRKDFYQVVPTLKAASSSITNQPLPSYVNVDWRALPENDQYVRYVYFLQNITFATIQPIIKDIISPQASLSGLPALDAFMITDKAFNIRTLMQVVEELDGVALPEAMSVLQLQNADAGDVLNLYNELTKGDGGRNRRVAQFLGQKNIPTKEYFPEHVKIVVEDRTNALIILGDRKSIKKIEDFIVNYIDTELKQPYSPLYVYDLQYTSAEDMASILSEVINNFSKESIARQYGSVRGGEKYFQSMVFEAQKEGNRLLIKAEKEDWLMVKRIIEQLDVPQPQVAIEVLVLDVSGTDNKELGVQIRNKTPDFINPNIDFQNSGLPDGIGSKNGPVVRPDTGGLAANLIELAKNQTVGSTLISVGNAATGGVWALFKMLQTHAHTEVLSNPYLVTTNKYEALISLGETRRVVSSTVVSGDTSKNSETDKTAALTLRVTPQINRDGIINLDIFFELSSFTSAADSTTNADTMVHKSQTNANVADGEVLAFGGFLQTNVTEQLCKTPLLGDMPVVGWFFKNKTKEKSRDNILVFISPHIIEPRLEGGLSSYSEYKINDARQTLCEANWANQKRDPIHRWFFKDHDNYEEREINEFITQKGHEADFNNTISAQQPTNPRAYVQPVKRTARRKKSLFAQLPQSEDIKEVTV